MPEECPRFSDFAEEEAALSGEKIKIDDVIGKDIIITGFKVTTSKYKKSNAESCLKLQFKMGGVEYVLFTGSNILIEQIQKYKEHVPFSAQIKCVDKYFTLT